MAESEFPQEFLEPAAALIGLPIPAENADGVRANFERIAQMAAPLLAVALPDEIESAAVFEPEPVSSGDWKP